MGFWPIRACVGSYLYYNNKYFGIRLAELRIYSFKVTVDLQRPNFANFVFFAPDIAKTSI